MVETHWENLRGEQLRYSDNTWALTGDVEILKSGDILGVEATQVDDVRHSTATLYFGLQKPPGSLNLGNFGNHIDILEQEDDYHYLVIKKEQRTYRHELQRLEYE